MRVAFLSHNARSQDAVGNQIAEKVRFFLERGAEVRVFVEDARRMHAELQSICTAAQSIEDTGPVWDYLRQADLVIAVYSRDYALLQILPRLVGVGPRILFDYHGVTPPALALPAQRPLLERSERHRGLAWCADHVLATSKYMARELALVTRFPGEATTVLPLPVDVARFQGPRDRWLHDRLGIQGRILLYVGRLAANKRVSTLIDALARMNDPRLHAVIVGDASDVYAEEATRCTTLAAEWGVAERVHWFGQVSEEDLPRVYRSADVFVMPSLHEGFCVPVVEAMASGIPVVAARRAALPETLGDAGLTFAPDDADDLAMVLRRVLAPPPGRAMAPRKRVAIVSYRYGADIIGGAETSLRSMAAALHDVGYQVEVFSTCTRSENAGTNDIAAGTTFDAGIAVHRFAVDTHDPEAKADAFRAIIANDGQVTPEIEQSYLAHGVRSAALLDALRRREHEFDAILVGPYLTGLTVDVVQAFGPRAVLVPCYHDEPIARLAMWPRLYRDAAGVLYHSPEEREFAQSTLGINHPNCCEVGARVAAGTPNAGQDERYVVYCGRYSEQKNVPLLIEWMQRYHEKHPGELTLVMMGQGSMPLPDVPWLRNLGRVDEATKRRVLRSASALVQLSTCESLSLVVLEAWSEGTPVIVHDECAVLCGQIERSRGGVSVGSADSFIAALADLTQNGQSWHECGLRGHRYVMEEYASPQAYVERIVGVIDRVGRPLVELLHERGLQRAQQLNRAGWQARFAELIDRVLTQPARRVCDELMIEPTHDAYRVAQGTRSFLISVRVRNQGTHAAAAEGPGRTELGAQVLDARGALITGQEWTLPALLMPGEARVAVLPVAIPDRAGVYVLRLHARRIGGKASQAVQRDLHVEDIGASVVPTCSSAFLDDVARALPDAHRLQQLPTDYVDVTEGFLARLKRKLKRKILHNFKHAYVDVLSSQQSQLNRHVVQMIQQLADCCATLDHAVKGLHQRLDGLEEKLEQLCHADPQERKPTNAQGTRT